MFSEILIILQQLPANTVTGTDILAYGGAAVGGGGGVWAIREGILKILEKIEIVSKKIDKISIASDEKKEVVETQKKKTDEIHNILSETNEVGQKKIHATYYILKEFSEAQKQFAQKVTENLTVLTALHKNQEETQKTNQSAFLHSLESIANAVNSVKNP